MKINVLISKNSWAQNYKGLIKNKIFPFTNNVLFYNDHKKLRKCDLTIILSYFKIIEKKYLLKSNYNILVHESNLPKGRGMSPLTWQLLNKKKLITFSLINANEKIDNGDLIFKKKVYFKDTLLFKEIKSLQLKNQLYLIIKFLNKISRRHKIKFYKQKGKVSNYKSRKPDDHEISIKKTIEKQFNLLRTSDNKNYPCFFIYKKQKYFIKIFK